jgi:SAM-dependent methyltransferase/uncharacterized protein YbaR (Trm112 family)
MTSAGLTSVQARTASEAADRLLANCRCVACGSCGLDWPDAGRSEGIVPEAISCASCGSRYDVIDGIPYLLILECRDFVALVEIAAEYDRLDYSVKNARPFDGSWVKRIEEYHQSENREKLLAALPPDARNDLIDRHQQWEEIQILSGHLDLADKNVLVLGAGLGFDAQFLTHRGARVTAADLNPHTNSIGRAQLPAARWIGALGRRLPFADGSFDHVFISASLHHVLDVSATIVEMLRVLKCGGSLVTSNDSYVSDSITDKQDARFWNDHPAVLIGINENRPRLKSFIDPLLARRDILDVEFWTSSAEDYLEPKRRDLWTQHQVLRKLSGGGIFMRVTPKAPIRSASEPVTSPIVQPARIASWIGNKTRAMAEIARLTPPEYMMPQFPGRPGNTKFQVLNGWRWNHPGELGRQAYRCGRWYLARRPEQSVLETILGAPTLAGVPDLTVEIVVDGTVKVCEPLPRGRAFLFEIDVSSLPVDRPFCAEIRLVEKDLSLEHGSFRVERFETREKLGQEQKLNLMLHEPDRLRVETTARDEAIAKLSQRLAAHDGMLGRLKRSQWWLTTRSRVRSFLKSIYLVRRIRRILTK